MHSWIALGKALTDRYSPTSSTPTGLQARGSDNSNALKFYPNTIYPDGDKYLKERVDMSIDTGRQKVHSATQKAARSEQKARQLIQKGGMSAVWRVRSGAEDT